MGPLRRHAVTIFAAVTLPLILVTGFQLYLLVDAQRQNVERTTTARAQELAALVDAKAKTDVKLASALATATSIANDDIPAAYLRAAELMRLSGEWRGVALSDPASKLELFDVRRPAQSSPRPISATAAALAAAGSDGPTLGGVAPDPNGGFSIPLYVPVTRAGKVRYVITVALDPMSIQRLAEPYFSRGGVGAVVDRDGRFIARSIDYADRVGTPATRYVRGAVKAGGSGIYRGVTYEGFSNYTAYATAPMTGWSSHLAVDSTLIDRPRRLAITIWTVVGLATLALSGFLVWLAFRDLAQRRLEEERLRQSQKLEAVGQLTGGIAHDFNNLLTAIIGSLDLVLKRSAPDDPHRRYLEGALDAATRGAKLTSRLLAFSRTQRLETVRVDVAQVIGAMSELLDQSLGPAIRVRVDVREDARWVRTDPNQLELALLNLALNARDAMPEGGRVQFSTRRADDQRYGGRSGSRPDDWVEIAVADTGTGMSPEVVERAFEPFYTTKETNKGTGLGLAQVFALARQSGGEVAIDSAVGSGTTVRLILPAATPEAPTADTPGAAEAASADPGVGRRILVLDDDDSVREVVVENLRARGHAVFEAASGQDALNALESIDPELFVLDFLMPGLNGAEVARRAREARPGQKILIVSGHIDHAALAELPAELPILRKPFDGAQLAAKVNEILAET